MTENHFADGLATLATLAEQTVQARTELDTLEKQRDAKIVALLNSGKSTREVAAAAGVTQARVVQIHSKARAAGKLTSPLAPTLDQTRRD
jgi:DNA-directed RNA polymerase specialized sigma subunit